MKIELIIKIATLLCASCGFLVAFMEYRRQGRTSRLATLLAWRNSFEDLARKHNLVERLEQDDPALADIPFADRAEMIGLLEGIELAVQNRIMDEKQVQNFFGYYASKIPASIYFLHDFPTDSPSWQVFTRFAKRMNRIPISKV
jgi:hypothetical protein